MKIGKRLSSLIKAKGLTQEKLATLIGLESQSFISAICTDKKLPSLDTLYAICDALHITVSDFFRPLSNQTEELLSPHLCSLIDRCKVLSDTQIKLIATVASNFESEADSEERDIALIPLLGSAAAGSPLNNGTFPEETIMAPSKFGDSSKYFAITVKGDSMSPLIRNGDYAIILYNSVPEPNDIVLIRSDDIADVGYAIKKFKKSGSAYQFISLNPSYPPLTLNPQDVISVEKVVHIIHVSV